MKMRRKIKDLLFVRPTVTLNNQAQPHMTIIHRLNKLSTKPTAEQTNSNEKQITQSVLMNVMCLEFYDDGTHSVN